MTAQRLRLFSAVLLGLLVALSIAAPVGAAGDHFRGRLVSFHAEDVTMKRTVTAGYELQVADGRHYRLNFRDTSLSRFVGRDVELTGTRQGRTVTVAGYQLMPDSKSTQQANSVVAATSKNVAVLLFNFRNDTAQPYTAAFAADVMFNNNDSVKNRFAEESYGQLSMTGQVFGWYTIDYDNTGCNYTAWGSAARAAAVAAGVNFNGFTNYVYAFPWAAGCGWAGLAYLPGQDSYNNQYMDLRVNSHELSHNFGVHHASTINCVTGGVRVALSANMNECSLNEYGDPFTVMGSAYTRHSNAFHKAQMGWLGAAGDRQNVTTAGTYSVGPEEISTSSPKVLRVARAGASNQYFYIDFRQPYGTYFDNFGATDAAVNGVMVRIGPDYGTLSQSWLVDCTPETSDWYDAALPVGRTFSDPLSGVSFTTQGVSASGAVVAVSFTGDTQPPTPPGNFRVTTATASSLGLAWNASTDNSSVAGYRVSRDGTQVGTTSGTSFTDTGLQPNTAYNYSVVAYDAANNVSAPATTSGTTGAADTTPPTNPTNLKATVAKSGVTSLTWNASTDANGVAGYRVYRNGSLLATTASNAYSAKKARGTWTYYVVAFDGAGNVSGQSNSVTVTVR